MWHGVPIVGHPGIGDQPDNAWKAAQHGAGIALPNIFDVKEAQQFDAVTRILREPSFKQDVEKVSRRLGSRKRLGSEEAVGM